MPRLLTLLCLVAALGLAACGDDDGGGDPTAENATLFATPGFTEAYDAVTEKAGDQAPLLEVQITAGGAEFTIRSGEQATGFVYTQGELHDQEVDVIGPGSLEGQDFPISVVDPAAIDKIVDGVKAESNVSDLEVTVMTLDKSAVDGQPRWTVNARGRRPHRARLHRRSGRVERDLAARRRRGRRHEHPSGREDAG